MRIMIVIADLTTIGPGRCSEPLRRDAPSCALCLGIDASEYPDACQPEIASAPRRAQNDPIIGEQHTAKRQIPIGP